MSQPKSKLKPKSKLTRYFISYTVQDTGVTGDIHFYKETLQEAKEAVRNLSTFYSSKFNITLVSLSLFRRLDIKEEQGNYSWASVSLNPSDEEEQLAEEKAIADLDSDSASEDSGEGTDNGN